MELHNNQVTTTPDAPRNALEQAIIDAREGLIPQVEFIRAFVHSVIFVPSVTMVEADGKGLRPLLHQTTLEPGAETRAAVFTDADRATELARLGNAPYLLQIACLDFLKRVPPGLGVIVNPGSAERLRVELGAVGIPRIVHDADAGIL